MSEVQDFPEIAWIEQEELYAGGLESLRTIRNDCLVLHGQYHSRAIADQVCAAHGIGRSGTVLALEGATELALVCAERLPAFDDCSTLIAIGGGSVQDAAKLLAARHGKRLIVLPTLIATDGVASPVAVIREAGGASVSLGAKAPDLVFLCWPVLAQAPHYYWQALIGDIVGNLVAVRDLRRFGFAQYNDESRRKLEQGCLLAESAAMQILDCERPVLGDERFHKLLVAAAIKSSFAMIHAGSSEPCSGAEHLLSHAIDNLNLGMRWLHGTKVGAAAPFCLGLHGEMALRTRLLSLYASLNMPASLGVLDEEIARHIPEILRVAPETRPQRRTILDQYTASELLHQLTLSDPSEYPNDPSVQ